MKKIFSYAMMLLATTVALTSCEDDRDSNPTLVTPTAFVVNNPAVGSAVVDMNESSTVNLTWSQPVFTTMNAPVEANYEVQVSPTGKFTKKYDEAAEDNTGADYFALAETYTECNADVPTADINKAVEMLEGWQSDADVPADITVNLRIRAFVQDATQHVRSEILSNVVTIKTIPFYIELKDALPQLLYFVGPGATGNWNNSADEFIPMSLVKDAEYDKKTGEGEFTYTGWFAADQFKLVLIPGNWAPMYGVNSGSVFFRATESDADPGCWQPEADGYYTFKFSTVGGSDKATASLTKYEGTPKEFDGWELIGSFNDWGNEGTVVLTKNSHSPHIWHATATFSTDCEAKFRLCGSWDDECGGDAFPYGLKSGNNIKIAAGSYKIVYNDIDRSYFFISE